MDVNGAGKNRRCVWENVEVLVVDPGFGELEYNSSLSWGSGWGFRVIGGGGLRVSGELCAVSPHALDRGYLSWFWTKHPSCEEFDSGVENLESPPKYIIRSSRMNTHILPGFIVSFRVEDHILPGFIVSFRGVQKVSQPPRLPNSDWMPFRIKLC